MIAESLYSALLFALALGDAHNTDQVIELERPPHDHTIYILSGSSDLLAKFHAEVGTQWEGGELLEADQNKRVYRYWAYDWRTAPQARQFMMPAIFSGLELEFEAYDDAKAFPKVRAELDRASLQCEMTTDIFLILPTGQIAINVAPEVAESEPEEISCLLDEIRSGRLLEREDFDFIGNGKVRTSDD